MDSSPSDRSSAAHPVQPEELVEASKSPPRADATVEFVASEAEAIELARILDDYLERLKAGTAPDRQTLLESHPELAKQLEACLGGLELLQSATDDHASGHPQQLGEFRLLHEIGRGGMGAVYEARQLSLGRRVAIKVLHAFGSRDPESLQRFQREAETVARLHHTNIVPIFAVGNEHGVNYYAMQFIEGESLDETLRSASEPLDPRRVTEWCLQAAEALEHAHTRGVIHRDIKPSNLILDGENRIWLTDFGLAKRENDVSLSMTGALLGTPRYMSPEQAAPTNQTVDYRTDVYSLGATLYELLTGEPVFDGVAPHHVITQVLSDDPVPPRQHQPSLPRDLETIVLKCLAKDPSERYATARDLGHDLRAFLEGRAISARRANLVERAAKWVQRQKKSVALTLAAVGATLTTLILLFAARYAWERSQIGWFMGRAANPPLVAELTRDGKQEHPPLILPTPQLVSLKSGDLQVHVSGTSRLGETYDLTLHPGQSLDHRFDLSQNTYWQNIDASRGHAIVRGTERDHVLVFTATGMQLIDGITGQSNWQLHLTGSEAVALPAEMVVSWPWDAAGTNENGLGAFDRRPHLVSQLEVAFPTRLPALPGGSNYQRLSRNFIDLNGDDHADLLIAARHQAWILAVDGQTGEPLWTVAREDISGSQRQIRGIQSGVVYPPSVVPDQNGDGTPEILTLFAHAAPLPPSATVPASRWIELISGADGESLWTYAVPDDMFELPAGVEAPAPFQWFYGRNGGYSSGGSSHSTQGDITTREGHHTTRVGDYVYVPSPLQILPAPVTLGESADANSESAFHVQCFSGSGMFRLDGRTGGLARAPVKLGLHPVSFPRRGSFDDDEHIDWLFLEKLDAKAGSNGQAIPQLRLVARSGLDGKQLWDQVLEAEEPRQHTMYTPIVDWPVVVDLDGDGLTEVIVPTEFSTDQLYDSAPWGKCAVMEGRDGSRRWVRQLMNLNRQLDHFLPGPDLDGDGVGEVYFLSQWSYDQQVYVDCLSGADGHTLWREAYPVMTGNGSYSSVYLAEAWWYEGSGDDWPTLVLSARSSSGEVPDRTLLVSAADGRVLHLALDVAAIEPAQLDDDPIADLVLYQRSDNQLWSRGVLSGVRGRGREFWRRLSRPLVPVGDLDRDGVSDLIDYHSWGNTLVARSGATGESLWRTNADSNLQDARAYPARTGRSENEALAESIDLNGDSTPDFFLALGSANLQTPISMLQAVSGKTGRILWKSELEARRVVESLCIDCQDLDGDGEWEVIGIAEVDDRENRMTGWQYDFRLFVLSAKDGRLRWQHALTTPSDNRSAQGAWLKITYGDLNGDGVLDLLVPAEVDDQRSPLRMRAFSGAGGHLLWEKKLATKYDLQTALVNAAPAAIGDLDGDGRDEAILLDIADLGPGGSNPILEIAVLEGASGELRWSWRTETDAWGNRIDQNGDKIRNRLRPILLERGNGRRWIAVAPWRNAREIYVIDDQGKLVSSTRIEQRMRNQGTRVWPVRCGDEPSESLLILSRDALLCLDPTDLTVPRWSRPVQTGIEEIVGVLGPEVPGRMLIQGDQEDCRLQGFDPRDGTLIWTCPGPVEAASLNHRSSIRLLEVPSKSQPSVVLFQIAEEAFVRSGELVANPALGENESLAAVRRAWGRYHAGSPRLMPTTVDPRLLRGLPWVPPESSLRDIPLYLAWLTFFGFTLVAVPGGYIAWLIRHRSWSLRVWMFAPVVVAIVMLGVLVDPRSRDMQSTSQRLTLALLTAGPVILASVVIVRWIRQQRWRRVTAWFVANLLTAAVIAVVVLTGHSDVLASGERYSWSGWYLIIPPVLFAGCWLLAGWQVVHLLRKAITRLRGRQVTI